MGLDTVELVMEFEKRFQVEIPDKEWEQVSTIAQAVEKIKCYKSLVLPERDLFGEIYVKIVSALKEMDLISQEINKATQLKNIFTQENLKQNWTDFERKLGLKIPALSKADFNIHEPEKRTFGILFFKPDPPFLNSDLARLIDCICALNFEQLIDFENISSPYEILVAVMGLTQDKAGVEISMVFPESSFTNDLGLD